MPRFTVVVWTTLVCAGLTAALLARTAEASERSELLVAKGEVAYHAGRYAEARDFFTQAVAADEQDAEAHGGLGLALLALGQRAEAVTAFERALVLRPGDMAAVRGRDAALAGKGAPGPGERWRERSEVTGPVGQPIPGAGKRWEVHASTGVEYDSNVTLAPRGDPIPGLGKQGDVGFVLSGGGRFDVIDRPDLLFRLEYDLYQTLHPDLDDFDFRSQRIRGTVSYALRPQLWAGVQGGYNYYTLGPHSYLGEPYVAPFVSLLQQSWGMTQIGYRHAGDTYLSAPFHEVRDGPSDGFGVSQAFFLPGGAYLNAGYQLVVENPDSTRGNDYQFISNQGYVGGGFPAWWQTFVDVMYLYRNDNYTKPNSFAGFRKTREDNGYLVYAAVRRPITAHVSAVVSYYGTINDSNLDVFAYNRHVVGGALEFSY